jgi:hypothetical protein
VVLTGADRLAIGAIEAELRRALRYDDESIVHSRWVHQRYVCAVGARFSSASIHHGHRSEGRVHGISGAHEYRFVIDAAGQIAERLMNWTMLERDDDLRRWLPTWRQDGGDAGRFRQSIAQRFGSDEAAAWRYCEHILVPRRLEIRQVARALLVHPRHLPYNVAAAVSGARAHVNGQDVCGHDVNGETAAARS